jgi:hydroxymethylglutaryl-CoA lyase
VPNLRGAERVAKTAVDDWVCFVSASESHSKANSNCSITEAVRRLEPVAELATGLKRTPVAAIATAFGCPFEGETPTERVTGLAREFHGLGFRTIKLGDTIGTAYPRQVSALVGALRAALPDVTLVLHFHNTRGLALANVMAGLAAGVVRYESSLGGIGGCPFAPGATGNVATEDLVHFLQVETHETGINLPKLIEAGHWLETLLGRELPAHLLRAQPIGHTVPLVTTNRAVG